MSSRNWIAGVGLGASLRDAGDDLTANWTGGINWLNNPYPADKGNRFFNVYKTKDMRLLDAMPEALKWKNIGYWFWYRRL